MTSRFNFDDGILLIFHVSEPLNGRDATRRVCALKEGGGEWLKHCSVCVQPCACVCVCICVVYVYVRSVRVRVRTRTLPLCVDPFHEEQRLDAS